MTAPLFMCGGSSKSVNVDGAGGAEVSGQWRCVNPLLGTCNSQFSTWLGLISLDTGIPSMKYIAQKEAA